MAASARDEHGPRVIGRRAGTSLELANVHRGPELALVLQLRATESFSEDGREFGADFLRSALRADAAPVLRPHTAHYIGFFGLFVFAVLFGVFGLAINDSLPPVVVRVGRSLSRPTEAGGPLKTLPHSWSARSCRSRGGRSARSWVALTR